MQNPPKPNETEAAATLAGLSNPEARQAGLAGAEKKSLTGTKRPFDEEGLTEAGKKRLLGGDTRVRPGKELSEFFPEKVPEFRADSVQEASHAEDCFALWGLVHGKLQNIEKKRLRYSYEAVYKDDTELLKALKGVTTAAEMDEFLKKRFRSSKIYSTPKSGRRGPGAPRRASQAGISPVIPVPLPGGNCVVILPHFPPTSATFPLPEQLPAASLAAEAAAEAQQQSLPASLQQQQQSLPASLQQQQQLENIMLRSRSLQTIPPPHLSAQKPLLLQQQLEAEAARFQTLTGSVGAQRQQRQPFRDHLKTGPVNELLAKPQQAASIFPTTTSIPPQPPSEPQQPQPLQQLPAAVTAYPPPQPPSQTQQPPPQPLLPTLLQPHPNYPHHYEVSRAEMHPAALPAPPPQPPPAPLLPPAQPGAVDITASLPGLSDFQDVQFVVDQATKSRPIPTPEVVFLLANTEKLGLPLSKNVPTNPKAGTLFLVELASRSPTPKGVSLPKGDGSFGRGSSTFLKDNGMAVVKATYHTLPCGTIQRRCYHLIFEPACALIHYLVHKEKPPKVGSAPSIEAAGKAALAAAKFKARAAKMAAAPPAMAPAASASLTTAPAAVSAPVAVAVLQPAAAAAAASATATLPVAGAPATEPAPPAAVPPVPATLALGAERGELSKRREQPRFLMLETPPDDYERSPTASHRDPARILHEDDGWGAVATAQTAVAAVAVAVPAEIGAQAAGRSAGVAGGQAAHGGSSPSVIAPAAVGEKPGLGGAVEALMKASTDSKNEMVGALMKLYRCEGVTKAMRPFAMRYVKGNALEDLKFHFELVRDFMVRGELKDMNEWIENAI